MDESIAKVCTRCRRIKALSEFHRMTAHPEGVANWCKECASTQAKERRSVTRRESFKHQLKRKYGITYEQYEKMVFDQNGLCAICGQRQIKGQGEHLHVDHCHATGKVRALLCSMCNCGLGQFQDDVGRLEDAIEYLKHHSA